MEDITIVFLTSNRVPEQWAEFHKKMLLEAADGCSIISLSRKPMDFGVNVLQTENITTDNIYYQLLRGAKLAKTPYMAVAEDDTLYTKEHFKYRNDGFAYNSNRWCLYTWGEPVYHLKNYIRTNAVMICPTALAIEALEERFAKYQVGAKKLPLAVSKELGHAEARMGITIRKHYDYKSETPVVQLDHDYWTSGLIRAPEKALERHHQKNYGTIKAYDIPIWGKAENLVKRFK